MSPDTINRTDPGPYRFAGTGVPHTRHCLVCDQRKSHQRGGTYIRFRGIRTWCCGECNEKRKAKA